MAISAGPGRQPLWSPDGLVVFYETPAGMMAVPVEPGANFRAGSAEILFEGPYFGSNLLRQYDLSPDGEQFLRMRVVVTGDADATPEAILVKNWFEELKRLVPLD